MKARELMAELFALTPAWDASQTCDTCKAGDPAREVSRIAVTMFPTVQVLREAAQWGAELLIVHEPLYFNHSDQHLSDPVNAEKRALVESSGMTIFRYHDHPHRMMQDQISEGFWHALALPGKPSWGPRPRMDSLLLMEPMTPRDLARRIESRLGLAHVRICGAADAPCTHITAALGARGNVVLEELKSPETQIVLAGEVCEWSQAEYARDAAALGHSKALLILGHVGSERDGVAYLAQYIHEQHPELTVKYFDCDEVYTYTDSH